MYHSRKSSVLSLSLAVILLVCLLPMASLAGAAPLSQGKSYMVQKDDCLWNVAEKYLGNGAAFPAIVDATNKKAAEDATFAIIDNPSLIQPGWKLWVPSTEEAKAFMARFQRPTPTATIEVPVIVITALDPSATPIPNRWPCIVPATQFDPIDFRDGDDLQALRIALQSISDKYQLALFATPDPKVWGEIDGWFAPTGMLTTGGWGSWGTQVRIEGDVYSFVYPFASPEQFPGAEGVPPVGAMPTRPPPCTNCSDATRRNWTRLLDELSTEEFFKEQGVSEESIRWMAYPLATLSAAQEASDPLEFDELLRESLLTSFDACSILPPGTPDRQVVEQYVIPDLLGLAALREVWIEPEMMVGRAPLP